MAFSNDGRERSVATTDLILTEIAVDLN